MSLYNETVTIRRVTRGQDAYGQPTETWSDYITGIPAHFYSASAYQKYASSKITDFFTHRMLCPVVDITTEDKVVCDGETYKVVAVNYPPFGGQLTVDMERIK